MSEIDGDATVRELHARAMDLANEARMRLENALNMYRMAAAYERMALDRVREVPDNEPTASILEISYRSLVLMGGGKIETATALGEGVDLGRRTA